MESIEAAKEKFGLLLAQQRSRVAAMRAQGDFIDYSALDKIIIGTCGGDGIGPILTKEAQRVLQFLLQDELAAGKVEIRPIEGLTLENRIAAGKAIPDDVLDALKACHVILKGPTTTPRPGDGLPNLESANVVMRKELDLFANVRPVQIPALGIDWTFFRENTEGAYTLGSKGFETEDGISVDFTVTTTDGTERIAQLAYDFAEKNHKNRVSIVTKANIIKATDGKFLALCRAEGEKHPHITTDDWYIDIMTANLVNENLRAGFQVVVLPNLYGDIITDEAAQLQGGVGTAGSANIGKRYAMFEAIHGTAPRMIAEGLGDYANPCSILRACVMMLSHIGYQDKADKLAAALDKCTYTEKAVTVTGTREGATCSAFGDYLMRTIAAL